MLQLYFLIGVQFLFSSSKFYNSSDNSDINDQTIQAWIVDLDFVNTYDKMML